MKHLFIINPAAGSRDRTLECSREIVQLCRDLDYRVEISKGPGDCRRLANAAARSGEEYRIYACGGDGTLNEVAAGAAGYGNAAVTVWAGGSGNDFVRLFSEPRAFCHLARLLDAEETAFDMICCNDSLALNICSVGLDARIGTDVANYKRLPLLQGFWAYAASAVVNVVRSVSQPLRVTLCGQTRDEEMTMVCVCNGRYYGGGFMPVAEARMDDGVLNTLVVKKVSRLTFMKFVNPYSKGQYYKFPHLARCSTPKVIRIRSEKPDIVTCLDGECITSDDVTIQLSDKRLNFFGPAGCSCNRTARKPLI